MALRDPLAGSGRDHAKAMEKQFADQAARMALMMKAVWDDKGYKKVFADLNKLQTKMQENIAKKESLKFQLRAAGENRILKDRLKAELAIAVAQGKSLKNHQAASEKSVDLITNRLEGAVKAIGSRNAWIDASKGAREFTTGFAEGIHDALSGVLGKDISSVGKLLQRSAAGAIKLGEIGEKNTQGGALGKTMAKMGGFLSTIGPAIAAIGAVALGLAAVVKIVMDADAKVKELNKEILGAGVAAGDLVDKFGEVDSTLTTIRKSFVGLVGSDAQKFVQDWGVSAKENLQILNSFATAGYTVNEMMQGVSGLNAQQEALRETTATAMTYAKLLGESSDKIAGDMGEMMNELGVGLSSIKDRFSEITKAAGESGFGTKRFYGMIVQLSTGMSMLNVRFSDTAALLTGMSKILGQKGASEFAGGMKGHNEMSTKDRTIAVMKMGGGNAKKINKMDAEIQADAFGGVLRDLIKEGGEKGAGVQAALTKAGLTGLEKMSPEQIAEAIGKQSQDQMAKLMANLNNIKGVDALGSKQLNLWKVAKAGQSGAGNLGAQQMGYGAQGRAGELASRFAAMKGFAPNQGLDKAALDNIQAGIMRDETTPQDQKDAMEKLAIQARGELANEGNLKPTFDQFLKKISQITTAQDKSAEASQADIEKERAAQAAEDRAVAMRTADATTSMSDRMESVVEGLLESINDGVQAIWKGLPNWISGKDSKASKSGAMDKVDKDIEKLQKQMADTSDKTKRRALRGQIATLRAKRALIHNDSGSGSQKDFEDRATVGAVGKGGTYSQDELKLLQDKAAKEAEAKAFKLNMQQVDAAMRDGREVKASDLLDPKMAAAGARQEVSDANDKALGGGGIAGVLGVGDVVKELASGDRKLWGDEKKFERALQLNEVPIKMQKVYLKALQDAQKDDQASKIAAMSGVTSEQAKAVLEGTNLDPAIRAKIEAHKDQITGAGIPLPVHDAVMSPSGRVIIPDPGDTVAFGKPGGPLSKGGSGGGIVNIHVYHDVSVPKMIRDAMEQLR